MKLKLSIIIPAYNSEKYISRCLESILYQKGIIECCEIIVINDGSTDNTLCILKEYNEKHPALVVHTQPNLGVGTARNVGLEKARGEYIYFLDSDDYLRENVLEVILNKAKKLQVDIMTFNSVVVNEYDSISASNTLKKPMVSDPVTGMRYISQNEFRNEVWWYIIKREFLLNAGIRFVEGRWLEDAIYTPSLFLKAKRMAHIELDAHVHVEVPDSIMTNKEALHYRKVIFDLARVAIAYGDLTKGLPDYKYNKLYIQRIRERQESFIFFMIIRAIKSNFSFKELDEILKKMKSLGIYPLRNFPSVDYKKNIYKLLTYIVNDKFLLLIGFRSYRIFKIMIGK